MKSKSFTGCPRWSSPPIMKFTGRLRPKGVLFFCRGVYERIGISLVEVYETVAKSFIAICKMT